MGDRNGQSLVGCHSSRHIYLHYTYGDYTTDRDENEYGKAGDRYPPTLGGSRGRNRPEWSRPSLSVLKTTPRFAAIPTTWCRSKRGALGRGRQRLSGRGLQRPFAISQ
ncbi:uncharacterized protein B0T23DRAFT_244840 [Neurospora hispaniola]|uniref:Uncharacterized protein n=1 Tax=Neurospora hispaniola TaxID=588809 RepID=A0AAJ0HZR5_9PEZI|nr:hypothetical protein B0T23DRAFT_244840 [Neurospora hispaniola]